MNPSLLFHLRRRPSTPAEDGAASGPQRWTRMGAVLLWPLLLRASPAQASFLAEGTLDVVANVMSWVVLIIGPIIAIGVFLIIHILPEKFAEKRRHPQLPAIKALCWMSLVFGGLLWPICWVWAFSRPVFYKQAYGREVHEEDEPPRTSLSAGSSATSQQPAQGER